MALFILRKDSKFSRDQKWKLFFILLFWQFIITLFPQFLTRIKYFQSILLTWNFISLHWLVGKLYWCSTLSSTASSAGAITGSRNKSSTAPDTCSGIESSTWSSTDSIAESSIWSSIGCSTGSSTESSIWSSIGCSTGWSTESSTFSWIFLSNHFFKVKVNEKDSINLLRFNQCSISLQMRILTPFDLFTYRTVVRCYIRRSDCIVADRIRSSET